MTRRGRGDGVSRSELVELWGFLPEPRLTEAHSKAENLSALRRCAKTDSRTGLFFLQSEATPTCIKRGTRLVSIG